jgi:predicted ATPase
MKIRWKNFKAFKDTGWIDLKPITFLIGPNATGKTTIFQPLLLLSQTLKSPDLQAPLLTSGDLVKVGTYKDMVYKHNIENRIEFMIDFWFGKETENKNTRLGDLPPMKINITFCADKFPMPRLFAYKVYDVLDRAMLERVYRESGKYSLNFFKEFPRKKKNDRRIYENIKNQKPTLFMFEASPIIRHEMTYMRRAEQRRTEKLDFSEPVSLYLSTVSFMEKLLNELSNTLKYIGPIRDQPQRQYDFCGERYTEVGAKGQCTFALLYRLLEDGKKRYSLNKLLRDFRLARSITCKQVKNFPHLLTVNLKSLGKNIEINYADSSFGLSQVLPVVVQSFMAEAHDLVVMEQPELHINPQIQILLAEFLVKMANDNDIHYLIETHSEHMIMRLRSLIKAGKIGPENVGLYFTELVDGEGHIRRVEINEEGVFPEGEWPKDFFEEALSESIRFATTKRK